MSSLNRWQLDEIEFPFTGGENLSDVLTGFPTKPQKRGRPSEITNDQLLGVRDQYVQRIEWAWGEIAWDLPRAKSAAQVQQIFQAINNENAPFERANCLTRIASPHPTE